MSGEFDFTKEYGLVLEGGGAKGAYQIGVWKALREYGVKIKGISGVSVGALNGALICMGEYERAEQLWSNITYSQIMDVEDIKMDKLVTRNLKELSIGDLTHKTSKFLLDRGFDINPLKQLIEESIDEDKIQQSDIEFVIGTFSITDLKELVVTAKEVDIEYLKDYLLASAYFPAFKNEKLHGVKYIDGGVVNNVPIDMLINRGYKDIIVLRIYGIGLEKKIKVPDNVNIIEIAPRVNLGGILEFNQSKSARNMKIGYYDGLRVLKRLLGKIYYIENSNNPEEYYVNQFIKVNESVKMALLEYFKYDFTDTQTYIRQFIIDVCPSIALELKLEKTWTYKELYISMLELCAKNLRMIKYKLYSENELLIQIQDRYEKETIKETIKETEKEINKEIDKEINRGIFVELILKAITIVSTS